MLKEAGTWNQEIVNGLAEAAEYLSEMLNNALDVTKLEEGKIEFNNRYESLYNIIDVVFSVVKSNADKRGVRLDYSLCKTLPELIEVDKTRLTQIIMNCVGNAIKFSHKDGRVIIRVKWLWKCGTSNGDCANCNGEQVEDDDSFRVAPSEELKEGETPNFKEHFSRVNSISSILIVQKRAFQVSEVNSKL